MFFPLPWQILQVAATDQDTGNNARITYRIKKIIGNGTTGNVDDETFGIFPNSGLIYLKENLDRETINKYDVLITATDNGTPPLTATCKILITVTDANDNDPKFQMDNYEFSIEENLPPNSPVGKISAVDLDYGQNSLIKYSFIPSNNSSFKINPTTGKFFFTFFYSFFVNIK